jgi:hypothetical protein
MTMTRCRLTSPRIRRDRAIGGTTAALVRDVAANKKETRQ